MKKQIIYIALLFLCIPSKIQGQTGNTLSNPIIVGTFSSAFNYSNSQNTVNFTNSYTARSPNDVYYRFTLNRKMEVTMSHCGSTLSDTYLILLDNSGNKINYNDDYYGMNACSSTRHSYLKQELDAGTYYVVSEGYNQNGTILTQISGTTVYVQGDSFQDPIDAGIYDNSFQYSNTQHNGNFTNQHIARAPNDIYYRFTLNKRMLVTMTHCGSEIDSYMFLLDASQNMITSNDDYSGDGACYSHTRAFIQKTLDPGTYYIVSEGYSSSSMGNISTNITGFASEEFDYPDIPSIYSSDPETVGGTNGAFNVSATGGATYSIPIEVPQGIGGLHPNLSITYNSQSGNGLVGWGCNVSGLSAITRTPKTIYHDDAAQGVNYQADDAYMLDGQRLILSSGTPGEEGAIYYPESNPFTKVIIHGTYSSTVPTTWFEVLASNGMIYHYGSTDIGCQSYSLGNATKIHAWYLTHVEDVHGNYMDYSYHKWELSMYPHSITYGNNKYEPNNLQNTVSFNYEYRNDIQPFIIGGIKGKMNRRLSYITVFTGANLYRMYEMRYDDAKDETDTKFSRLISVTEKNAEGESLKPIKLNWSFLSMPDYSPTQISVNSVSTHSSISLIDQKFTAADLNGDGFTDIIGTYLVTEKADRGSNTNIYACVYSNTSEGLKYISNESLLLGSEYSMENGEQQIGTPFMIDLDGDGINNLVAPIFRRDGSSKKIEFRYFNPRGSISYEIKNGSQMPVYGTGDFNKDGRSEIIFLEKNGNSNRYFGEIVGLNSEKTLYRASFNLYIPGDPQKMFISDYNNDGLEDMLIFYNGGYTIFWNQGGEISNSLFSSIRGQCYSADNIGNVWMIQSGDFNGDGLADFLMNSTNDSNWYFALNKGNGDFEKMHACTLGVYDQSFVDLDNDKFDCFVFDFDHDGKSDVVIHKSMYTKQLPRPLTIDKTYTYWMRSTGSSLTIMKEVISNNESILFPSKNIIGDFNGDGKIELMNYGYDCYNGNNTDTSKKWRIYKDRNFSTSNGKINTITNSYGVETRISYASLVNSNIYTKGTGSSYPVVDYTLPIHAVQSVSLYNSGGFSMITNYQYKGLKLHLQGKGILGMASQTANNTTLGIVAESGVKSWNADFYMPSETYTKTTQNGNTAETNVTLTIVDKGSKKFFVYPSTQTDKDMDGNIVTTTRKFNTVNGYLTEEKADFGSNMYKILQYDNYVQVGGAWRPQLITQQQKHTDDNNISTQKTKIEYDLSKGYQTMVINNHTSSQPLTTKYTYDTFGNVLSSIVSGEGVETKTHHFEYDATNRFIKKNYTAPASFVKTFTYNTWGNVLTEKDETNPSNILTVNYIYDTWNNLKSVTMPDGRKTVYDSGWNNNSAKRYFILKQETGNAWVKIWYDNQGREVLSESVGAQNIKIKHKTSYNSKGEVTRKEAQIGNLTTTENYTYDNRGRMKTVSNSAGQNTTYNYGNRQVITNSNNRSYTKNYDAWGNVKSATDPAETISYTYYSSGNPKNIATGGATFSMTYYDTGLQKTLTDPSVGTITYEYDALGRLTKQIDGKTKTTINKYDALGRLDFSTVDGIVTDYTYGTSGYNLHQLTKVQMGNNFIDYSYDRYGRILTEKRQIEGESKQIEFSYKYNPQGQLSEIIYPEDLLVTRQYDAYGNLKKVLAGNQSIWELTGATGTIVTAQLGGALTSTKTHNSQGLLTNLKMAKGSSVSHNMNYVFDTATGNLTSRSGMMEQSESFVYDNVDRLTAVWQGGTTVMDIGYQANGNIAFKTGLGEYTYEGYQPHAVTNVENQDELISYENQSVNYTAFNKVSDITEKVGTNDYRLDISYGPDLQRWKSTLKKNGTLQKTTIFAGDYESITENGVKRHLYYLSGGGGLVAVYEKQAGQGDKIYYACTDHLGSIVKLVDGNGTEVFKASYDAWGNRTVINNTFAFHRGYTGHEHLAEFNLINMNGRVYDPVLGRFFSPDPYVQAPYFSQNYNRYAYCLNNPLAYIDPDGEWWFLVPIIAGGIMNWAANGADFTWEGLSYFGVGALAGASTLIGGPFAPALAGGITGAGNSFVSQGFAGENGNTWSWNNMDWGQVGIGGISGAIIGYLGGKMADKLTPHVSGYISGVVKSPVAQDMLTHAAVQSTTGFTISTGWSLANGASWEDALSNGWNGFQVGLVTGTTTGIVSGFQRAQAENVNPWTGNFKLSLNTNYDFTPDLLGNNVTLYRGMTGSENGSGSLFMTTDPDYAAVYVQNGGKVTVVTIPKSTILLMEQNGALTVSTQPQYHISGASGIEYQFSPSVKHLITPRLK